MFVVQVIRDRTKKTTSEENHGISSQDVAMAFAGQPDLVQVIRAIQIYVAARKEFVNEKDEAEQQHYCILGLQCFLNGEMKEAIEYLNQSLAISRELGDQTMEKITDEGLNLACILLSMQCRDVHDFEKAVEGFNRHVMISKGKGAHSMGLLTKDFEKARKYYHEDLAVCKKVGDRAGEGHAYRDLGKMYYIKGMTEEKSAKYIRHAMSYYKMFLDIAKERGDKSEEGDAYLKIGDIHRHLGDHEQAKDHYYESFAISKEIGDREVEKDALRNLLLELVHLDDLQQAMELNKHFLTICKADRRTVYFIQGQCLASSGFLSDAVPFFQCTVQHHNYMLGQKVLNDGIRIDLREAHQVSYKVLYLALLQLRRTEEALFAAEKGRAQALADLLASQYGFEARQHDQLSQRETASELLTCTPSNTVFLAVSQNEIHVWLLQDGDHVNFSRQSLDRKFFEVDRSFIEKTYEEIGIRCIQCEDRSLDALRNKDGPTVQKPTDSTRFISEERLREMRVEGKKESCTSPPDHKKRLSVLYDAVVTPVIQHLRGNELLIVPDGPLFLIPFAALQEDESRYLCESFRIRVIPSLTCLKMIMDAPPDHHCKSGALIVGDPWVQEVAANIFGKPKLDQLPFARKEAEMVATIVKSSPLIGSDATKEEVLKKLNSVALIHIAAHGDIEHGEVVLTPNKLRTSKVPREEDFLLTMAEVLSVGIRARLVVLSCCHSGKGTIYDEGVVGIARAFLGAGARSVLVSLWAIDDEATLEFMCVFYQHLVKGKKASEALNCATNYMRESKDFGKICQWAPFVLIGDDVTLECFEGNLDVLGTVR